MVVFTTTSPQAIAALAPGSADLADETLGHHMVKTLPVFLGDEYSDVVDQPVLRFFRQYHG